MHTTLCQHLILTNPEFGKQTRLIYTEFLHFLSLITVESTHRNPFLSNRPFYLQNMLAIQQSTALQQILSGRISKNWVLSQKERKKKEQSKIRNKGNKIFQNPDDGRKVLLSESSMLN